MIQEQGWVSYYHRMTIDSILQQTICTTLAKRTHIRAGDVRDYIGHATVVALFARKVFHDPNGSPKFAHLASPNNPDARAALMMVNKPGAQNYPTDVLSRLPGDSFHTHLASSQPITDIWETLCEEKQ